jgi:succinate--hydroxymethylglutarate CoA-transferase
MIGAGNDKQFQQFCTVVLQRNDLASDPRFSNNSSRVAHRAELVDTITSIMQRKDRSHWLARLEGLGFVTFPDLRRGPDRIL